MIRPGLCSVTLRALPVEAVVEVAAAAGLEAIEWGADVHVPAGDEAAARFAREATERAGLAVAAYGSYHRAGADGPPPFVRAAGPSDFATVRATAEALGAPRIRIWAGATGSADATAAERERVVDGARAAAAAGGFEVAFEFHGGTLTDDAESARELADAAGVRLYWQPPEGMADEQALAGLDLLGPRVAALHVFSWWPGNERRRLAERAGLWRAALARSGGGDALLEFVPGDDPGLVASEAETLRAWIRDV